MSIMHDKTKAVSSKLIINVGDGPKFFIASCDGLNISPDNQCIEFYSPILIYNNESVEGDGFHLYSELLVAHLLSNEVTTMSSKTKLADNKVVLSDMKFIIDTTDNALNFYFKFDKGFIDGTKKRIESVDDVGVYLLSYHLHEDLDWWQNFDLKCCGIPRVASFYDMDFRINNLNQIMSNSLNKTYK